MPERFRPDRLRQVLASVERLLRDTLAATAARSSAIDRVRAEHRVSAANLAHYLAVRTHDLRPLQLDLASLSLSSLGRMEGNVVDTLHGVRLALLGLLGELPTQLPSAGDVLSAESSARLLSDRAVRLLGPAAKARQTRIMVTLPGEARDDRHLLRQLLVAGMDVARINLAHDEPATWTAMAANVRAVAVELGRRCQVLADLPGPKLRTGPLQPGPQVLRVKPARDDLGVVTDAVEVTFADPGSASDDAAGAPGETIVPLSSPVMRTARVGDSLLVIDTRGRKRAFAVHAVAGGVGRASTDRTVYLGSGCAVDLRRAGETIAASRIGALPALASHILLRKGDLLVLTRDQGPGRAAGTDANGRPQPARVACTLPEVFADVRIEQRILFDDGRIAGTVVGCSTEDLHVRITEVPPNGGKLRAEKGINLPDTDLHTSALGEHDLACLDWVAAHADLVGMSFVQRADDVARLQAELARRGRADVGVVLKIETAKAFERLPDLLFAGLQCPSLGVMVARGDLAVEVGYGRLAEVQEEILWLCEAAHVPVIWATQVLDSMARTGTPSRAEVTDAAMGVRAECVMLNKGPHIVETTRFLGTVLERMQEHQAKKRAMLRRLRVAGGASDADA